mmetsp:Transcript_95791/g.175369  ORF Transcript_95791/g.175369 Transcript_95791/m.175369 type:complete len:120 (-) Transcript_95791:1745-2104(-)
MISSTSCSKDTKDVAGFFDLRLRVERRRLERRRLERRRRRRVLPLLRRRRVGAGVVGAGVAGVGAGVGAGVAGVGVGVAGVGAELFFSKSQEGGVTVGNGESPGCCVGRPMRGDPSVSG